MLEGKYESRQAYHAARAKRWVLRGLIRHLTRWAPLAEPKPGYTIVVACHARLAETVIPSLRLLASQELTHLDRTLVVFDAPRDPRLRALETRLAQTFPSLRLECLYQTRTQAALLRAIAWGWVDCWLSYCVGIGHAATRHVMLHDMDAMLLRRDIVEERYRTILERGDHFLGTHWYEGNGIRSASRLAYIVEMMLDAAFLRERFEPIDLFGRVVTLDGATADLDILLYPQLGARRSVSKLEQTDWVHPGQVISQYAYLINQPSYVPPPTNNLFFIPYFSFLADDWPELLEAQADELHAAGADRAPLLDRRVDMRRLTPVHLRWVIKQIVRLEQAIAGAVRPEVRAYLEAIQAKCEGAPAHSLVDEVRAELELEQAAALPAPAPEPSVPAPSEQLASTAMPAE